MVIRIDKQRDLLNKTLLIGIILLLIFMSITPSYAVDNVKKSTMPVSNGNILYVGGNGPDNYTRIQDAIDNAVDGDTIFVYNDSSPYYENLVTYTSINLIGEDRNSTIIDGKGGDYVILLKQFSEGTTINGFIIQNSTSNNFGGITIKNTGFNLILNNIITKNSLGIRVGWYSDYNTISKNVIINNDYGMTIAWSDSNNITDNVIRDIEIDESFLNKITKNLITGQLLIYGYCNYNIISKNNIEGYASFQLEPSGILFNIWYDNYWKRPRILPKPIFGMLMWGEDLQFRIPWVQFDWFPAKEPYDI
jgi:parallel beta-helix repeat protein